MSISRALSRWLPGVLAAAAGLLLVSPRLTSMQAADLNPKALAYKLPDQLQWRETSSGAMESVLFGDPSKAGWYIILVKWLPHRMSRPHYHPNDRFATVISGTWWVGTGPNYDMSTTTPMGPGTVVTHFGKQIHYDGARDEEAVIEIVGMGTAEATPFKR